MSRTEYECADFVASIIGDDQMIRHDRTLCHPYEVDIVVPSRNLAVEFNGIHWHSEGRGKGREYHRDKFRRCRDAGYRLVTVWENDWNRRRSAVEHTIVRVADISVRLDASDCDVVEITEDAARRFLAETSLDGKSSTTENTADAEQFTANLALRHRDQGIVSVSSWRRDSNALTLTAYGECARVSEALNMLCVAASDIFPDATVIEYLDSNDHSIGAVLTDSGFVAANDIDPSFAYIVRDALCAPTDPQLEPEHKVDEMRLWDCGDTLYLRDVDVISR